MDVLPGLQAASRPRCMEMKSGISQGGWSETRGGSWPSGDVFILGAWKHEPWFGLSPGGPAGVHLCVLSALEGCGHSGGVETRTLVWPFPWGTCQEKMTGRCDGLPLWTRLQQLPSRKPILPRLECLWSLSEGDRDSLGISLNRAFWRRPCP